MLLFESIQYRVLYVCGAWIAVKLNFTSIPSGIFVCNLQLRSAPFEMDLVSNIVSFTNTELLCHPVVGFSTRFRGYNGQFCHLCTGAS